MLGLFALDLLGVSPARVRMSRPGAPTRRRRRSPRSRAARPTIGSSRSRAPMRRASFRSSRSLRGRSSTRTRRSCASSRRRGSMASIARARTRRTSLVASPTRRRFRSAAGVGGAPEAISLLERLGQIEPAGLAQQRTLIGATAKGPVTLETLAQRTVGCSRAPAASRRARRRARSHRRPYRDGDRARTAAEHAPATATRARTPTPAHSRRCPRARRRSRLSRGRPQSDAASVVAQIGFLSGVFEHAAFRVTAKGGDKAARAIAARRATASTSPAVAPRDHARRARGRVRGRRSRLASLRERPRERVTSARRRTPT